MIVIFAVIMAAGLGFAVWIFFRTENEPMIRRVMDVIMALATGGAAFMVIGRTMQIGIADWNDAKLAPVVAMTHGYQLYQDPDHGVMTGWIYGPIGALILLPSALGKDPTTAGLIGSFITAICYFAPAFWLFIRAGGKRVWWLVLLACLAIVWRTIYVEDLCRCAFIASPDGPALGLAACACAAIYHRRSFLNLAISALAAVLCVWSKQNFLPLPFGLILWIAMTDGFETSAVYLAMVAIIGVVVSAALMVSFGPANMYFHMVWLPRQHPFEHAADGLLWAWYLGIDNLIIICLPSLMLLGMAFLLDAWVRQPAPLVRAWFAPPRIRSLSSLILVLANFIQVRMAWFASRSWSVLLVTAVFLIPTSLLGFMKVGGYLNNLAVTDYFLFLAALCAALETCAEVTQWSAPSNASRASSAQKWILAIVSTVMGLQILPPAFMSVFGPQNSAMTIWNSFVHPYNNPRQTIYKYAMEHPNEIYCPWNPLITLLADGKLYHFEWGMLDRAYAKKDPTMEQFRAHVPANVSRIVYIGTPQSTFVQHAMNVPLKQIQMPELPGCTVYVHQD